MINARLEHSREQLWAKIKDVWLPEVSMLAHGVIKPSEASEEVVKMMSLTIMGELYYKGLMKREIE